MKNKRQISYQEEYNNHVKFVAFLKKRVLSDNYKASVSEEEYAKTLAKYDKAKLKLKFMKK